MTLELDRRLKTFIDALKQVKVVDKASTWWKCHEGVSARQALSVWLGKLLETQVPVKAEPNEDQPISPLRAWITKNGRQLEGHPNYKALSEEERKQTTLLGRYTLEVSRLLLTTAKTVLGEVPEEFAEAWIGKDRAVRVLPAQLASYPVLEQWCKDNAHRIKGHPRYQEQDGLEPLGDYEPEAIALPKREYERILGYVPEGGEEIRVHIGMGESRHRKLLYKIKLTEEPPF